MNKRFKKSFIRFIPFIFLFTFFLSPLFFWGYSNLNLLSFEEIVNPSFLKQFLETAILAIITAIISLIISYLLAYHWWLHRKKKLSSIIIFLVFIPIILGLLTRNYAWMNILSYTSIQYSFFAVVIVMTCIFIPYSFFILIHAFVNITENSLDAAEVMGARFYEIFTRVIFPQTLRHIYIAVFLVFTNSLSYYITPAMIGGGKNDMIGNIIWKYVDKGFFAEASGISIVFILYVLPLFVFGMYIIVKRRKLFLSR